MKYILQFIGKIIFIFLVILLVIFLHIWYLFWLFKRPKYNDMIITITNIYSFFDKYGFGILIVIILLIVGFTI